MESELSSEKRAMQWEGSFLVGREFPSLKGASYLENSFLLVSKIFSFINIIDLSYKSIT